MPLSSVHSYYSKSQDRNTCLPISALSVMAEVTRFEIPESFDNLAASLFRQSGKEEWSQNPRLYFLLRQVNRQSLFQNLLDMGVTDLWLPVPLRIVQKVLGPKDAKAFLAAQEHCLEDIVPTDLTGQHLALIDSECMEFQEVKTLGIGGFGEVHHVKDLRTGRSYARKVAYRSHHFKKHCEQMLNFKTELSGMRRVRHRHCVELVATCTDLTAVTLLFSPVADMDLAQFLDLDLTLLQLDILRRAVGCITSALAYLHQLNIRCGVYIVQLPTS
jgi:hypothetical protein